MNPRKHATDLCQDALVKPLSPKLMHVYCCPLVQRKELIAHTLFDRIGLCQTFRD